MNPAARILRVLERFHANSSSTTCSDLWRQYLIDNGPSTGRLSLPHGDDRQDGFRPARD
jgi:hypothetical protein